VAIELIAALVFFAVPLVLVLRFAGHQSKESDGRKWILVLEVARLLRFEFTMGERRSGVRQETNLAVESTTEDVLSTVSDSCSMIAPDDPGNPEGVGGCHAFCSSRQASHRRNSSKS